MLDFYFLFRIFISARTGNWIDLTSCFFLGLKVAGAVAAVAAFGALGIAAAAALNVGSAAATSHPRVGAGVRYGSPGVRSGANRRRSGTFILTLVRAIRMTGKCFVHRRPGSLVSALVLARRFERFKR